MHSLQNAPIISACQIPDKSLFDEVDNMLISSIRAVSFITITAALAGILSTIPGISFAQSTDREIVEEVSANFSSVATMTGEFVQFGPDGQQTGGVFYIERPGKIRFKYEPPAPIEVISNGRTVAVHNKKLESWSFYPLSKTPLKLLLSDNIDFDEQTIHSVVNAEDLTTIVMGDDQVFGDAVITLMFDPENYDLRQWTIKDPKGKETSVMVFNVQKNVKFGERMFYFDELAIRRRQQESNSNR
jgi:outer membrane lipoprotein-sorting protein